MKNIIILTLHIVCLSFSLYAKEHFLIHMDINRTIIAVDSAQNKPLKSCLDSALAKRYYALWDKSLEKPINYYDYVYFHQFPGKRDDKQIAKNRKQALKNLPLAAKGISKELHQKIMADIQAILSLYKQEPFFIFPSFYALVDYLEKNNHSYSIVFRTFGHDLSEVKKHLHEQIGFTIKQGYYKKGQLYFDHQIISSYEDMYNLFKQHKFLAISDDFFYWSHNQEKRENAKLFPINRNSKAIKEVFFDDNIQLYSPTHGTIINPVSLEGTPLDINELIQNKILIPVDMIEAILNKNYFINKLL